MRPPTLLDVFQARRRIMGYVTRTPLHRYIGLEKLIGASEVYVKHENHQRLGAFKMRGGINLLSQLSPEELERGVFVSVHGQPRPVYRLRGERVRVQRIYRSSDGRKPRQGGVDAQPRR